MFRRYSRNQVSGLTCRTVPAKPDLACRLLSFRTWHRERQAYLQRAGMELRDVSGLGAGVRAGCEAVVC